MALFHNVNTTDPDAGSQHMVDVTFGIAFIILFLISIILNPLSFLYHSRKKTLSCALYTYLAICDFVVNLWHPLAAAQYMLQEDRPTDHIATINERCAFFVYSTFSRFSGLLINIILICGVVEITRPNTTIPKGPVLRLVSALLGLYSLLQFLVAFSPDNIGPPTWAAWSLAIHYQNSLEVVVWVTYIIFFIPCPFAVVAAVQFLSNSSYLEVAKSEFIKIMMLTIPNFAYPLFLTVDFFSWHRGSGSYDSDATPIDANVMTFFGKTFIPTFSSAWNPVFVCLFTRDMRIMIRDMCKKRSQRSNPDEHDIL